VQKELLGRHVRRDSGTQDKKNQQPARPFTTKKEAPPLEGEKPSARVMTEQNSLPPQDREWLRGDWRRDSKDLSFE